jgi:hypothetical protein
MEQRHRSSQEIALRDEIGVEKNDEPRRIGLATKSRECMVDISSLSV